MGKELIVRGGSALTARNLEEAITAWALAKTDAASERRGDLLRDKSKALREFFAWAGKSPEQIAPGDVQAWQKELELRGYSLATIYALVSRVSSFYNWALKDAQIADRVGRNPVNPVRPKAPKPYATDSSKALSDEDARALLAVVRKLSRKSMSAKRDYAMLLLYFQTGMRREEIARLKWGDIAINGRLVLSSRVKGGQIVTREVREKSVVEALMTYLKKSNRFKGLQPDSPLWTRHDRAGKPGGRMDSHSLAKNLKRYAALARIGAIHLHMTRHTFARIVADQSGSMNETQDALGHKNLATTKVYVERVGVKRDRWSKTIARRLGR